MPGRAGDLLSTRRRLKNEWDEPRQPRTLPPFARLDARSEPSCHCRARQGMEKCARPRTLATRRWGVPDSETLAGAMSVGAFPPHLGPDNFSARPRGRLPVARTLSADEGLTTSNRHCERGTRGLALELDSRGRRSVWRQWARITCCT